MLEDEGEISGVTKQLLIAMLNVKTATEFVEPNKENVKTDTEYVEPATECVEQETEHGEQATKSVDQAKSGLGKGGGAAKTPRLRAWPPVPPRSSKQAGGAGKTPKLRGWP